MNLYLPAACLFLFATCDLGIFGGGGICWRPLWSQRVVLIVLSNNNCEKHNNEYYCYCAESLAASSKSRRHSRSCLPCRKPYLGDESHELDNRVE